MEPALQSNPRIVLSAQRSAQNTQADLLGQWAGDPQFMQSLARGLLALSAVAEGVGLPVTARQVSALTGLSVATARRCLYTLEAINYVRTGKTGAVAGPALAALAARYAASSPLISGCGPVLDALHEELGVTISLAVFDSGVPIVVASASSEVLLRLDLPVGATLPLHCSAAGKVYLASLRAEILAQKLGGIEYKSYTPFTATTAAMVSAQLLAVRRQGFAISDQELAIGIRSIAVPVRDGRGVMRGSINASMLNAAVGLRDLRSRIAPAVIKAATTLSKLIP